MKKGRLAWRENPVLEEGEAGFEVSADVRRKQPGAQWAIDAAPHVLIKVKRVFPRANQERSGWVILADTPEVARDIEWLRERYDLEAGPEILERLKASADRHRATEQAVSEILSGQRRLDDRYRDVDPGREHRDYQYQAADLALATGRLLLVDELGLGKSMSALLVLREPEALPALVVCLTHLPAQWAGEVRETFPDLRVHVVKTLEPYDPAARRGARGEDPDVLIVPWSKLRGWGNHLAGRVRTVIFDEAQELRKDGTQKYTAAAQVADGADYRVGLTATPVYNYAGEIHTIFEVLEPGALGTRREFTREWQGKTVQTIGGEHVAVGDPGALGTYLRAEGLMLRRTRKDVGRELPDVVRITHSIDSDRDLYHRLEEETLDLAELIAGVTPDRAENVASLAEARNRRAWQARGELDWKLRQATGIAKAPYVASFVELLLESEEQVVLYGWHRAVYEIWMPRLVVHRPMLYTGTESPNQKQRARDAFVDGECRVLIMSLRAGAGLDGLQAASHLPVFGELDWSPGMHEQCIGRLQRDGQDETVVAYFLVSENGTDPLMAEVLNLKRQQSEPILDPDRPLQYATVDHGDRIRVLAQDVLERRRRKV